MLTTNCEYLRAEIMDVIRLFGAENENITHYFSYHAGKYFNAVEYDGAVFDYEEEQETENDLEYKRFAKRFSKLAVYLTLSKAKGVTFPYGALTGIRPTKLAYQEKAAGRDFSSLFKKFGVSEENVNLISRVLDMQSGIYENGGGQDLFVSLPFCPTKCEYCSFITAPLSAVEKYVNGYISCVEREILSLNGLLSSPRSVYIGGGTPFVLNASELTRIYAAINALSLPETEYTVEAGRPDVFDKEKLALSAEYGVNRICVNPQSLNPATLEKIGRKHTPKQFFEAYEMADAFGFDINVDLIAGLADESAADFEYSLGEVIKLNPANITVHTLSLKSGAKLKENCKKLEVDGIGEMIALSREMLTAAGYEPYYCYRQKYQAGGHENCGWAKRGKACLYNIGVMEEINDNIAVGANAISKKLYDGGGRIERLASPKDIPTYIDKTNKIIAARCELFK